jgi:hypothetical protein
LASKQSYPVDSVIEFNMNAKPADRETVTFDYGIPAELFMASARAGHDSRCAIAALRPQRRRSGSPSRNFRPCARWVPGCRSVTNASMATTSNGLYESKDYPLQRRPSD